jgi:3-methyl-2-oxobutanoate hydroxymethyltransferase
VTEAVGIPVIGGAGGGPWLDGRVRLAQTAIGSAAKTLGTAPDSYAHVAQITLDAFTALIADARAGRHIKGDG